MTKKAIEIDEDDMMGEMDAPKDEHKPKEALDFPDRAKLEQQLTEAEQTIDQLTQKLAHSEESVLRTQADIANIHRRTERQVSDAHKFGVSKLLADLIPVLDSLEQSVTIESQENELAQQMREGMVLTLQMLLKVLTQFGVVEINPLHEIFDPNKHEVMMAQEHAELAPNTILQVLQKGYQLHERIIRPARVIVVKP